MDINSETLGELAINNIVLTQLVAFLIAKESSQSGESINEIHKGFMREFSGAAGDISANPGVEADQNQIGVFEARLISRLDYVLGLSESMKKKMGK